MKRALLLLLLPLMACSKPSPLRQADCVVELAIGGPPGAVLPEIGSKSGGHIFNIETGEEYEYDKFKEKFALAPSQVIKEGNQLNYKSAIINGKWKLETKIHSSLDGSYIAYTKSFDLDLKTMKYEDRFVSSKYPEWAEWESGTCKLVEPEIPEK